MRSQIKISIIILLAIFLGACASEGNKQLAQVKDHSLFDKKLVKCKTTKNDVKAVFGQPSDIDFDNNGNEKWIYTHIKKASKAVNFIPVANWFTRGTNDTNKKLVIIFNKDDTLQKYAFSESRGESKVGILN